MKGSSKAALTRIIRSCLVELTQKKQKPVLIIDEASILRLDVFTELHTITQFEGDSKPILPIVLAGQNNLIDNLMFPAVQGIGFQDRGKRPSGGA
jgi:type II secretory pathway predicted ATPase ExeA